MSNKRVNVLVYSGTGATVESVRHATWSLRRLLGPKYAVLTITGEQILKEPWSGSCALLVMPGGADMAYCRVLNGEGNRRIKQFVQLGGAYLGLCAGGYYGSARCEFEAGKKGMEVVGDRELAFFPGICKGLAFPGFVYHSEAGARAVGLKANKATLPMDDRRFNDTFKVYYNGGGAFDRPAQLKARGIEVLASFTDPLAVDVGEEHAAVVYCKSGEGAAMLTGPHPEFSGSNLRATDPDNPNYASLVEALKADDLHRAEFMKACLSKLGLQVSKDVEEVPSLSPLHLSSDHPSAVAELLHGLHENKVIKRDEEGIEFIKGENDLFRLVESNPKLGLTTIGQAVESIAQSLGAVVSASPSESQADSAPSDRLTVDSKDLPLRLHTHESDVPDIKQTPHFSHSSYFQHLKGLRSRNPSPSGHHSFGSPLLYGEVITSTSTLLEKNISLLNQLPAGFTATATTQVSGRGRGGNVWVSPPGSLMFSTVIRHPLTLTTAPVVFVQYLAAIAVVLGIRRYDSSLPGYDALPIKLKWPNDVYAVDPSSSSVEQYLKIAGILVNSSYAGGDYTLVVGIGVNVENPGPTTGLSQLATKAGLPPISLEKLLASILVQFENLYARFCRTGFDRWFEELYYSNWLHSEQIVSLETEGGARARIKGISTDFGLLIAEEVDSNDRSTGRKFQLQSDSNSFDFFKGLLKRKL